MRREGAQRLIVEELVALLDKVRQKRAAVVRNGFQPQRQAACRRRWRHGSTGDGVRSTRRGCGRSWARECWVYLWADGIYFGLRADDERLCVVMIGVNERGQKRFLAIEDGVCESKASWADGSCAI